MYLRSTLIFICIFFASFVRAQQGISPAQDDPDPIHYYCPLQTAGPYYFTTTVVTPTLNTPKGLTILGNINSSFQFSLAFTDTREEHSILINDGTANIGPYKFKYVNTLDGVKGKFAAPPAQTPPTGYDDVVTLPLCYTTPFTYASPLVFYQDAANANYGTGMGTYEWQAPKGWTINGTLSTGSNIIVGGPTASIGPDPLTTGALQVRARNNCSSTLKPSTWFKISIQRPVISVSANGANPLSLHCGDVSPVTFTVQNTSAAACITGYQWDLGAPNGWLYQGSTAPNIITTTTPTLTLSPYIGATPGNVTVTPLVNGVVSAAGSFTETVSFSSALPQYGINGADNICTNEAYSLNNALVTGSSVTWSVSPTGLATPSASTTGQVTLTRVGALMGVITLTATISNPCAVGQQQVVSKQIVIGTPKSVLTGPYDPVINAYVSTVYTNKTYYFYATEATPSPPQTYTWLLTPPPGDNFPTGYSGSPAVMSFFQTGSYTLQLSKTNSCGTAVTSKHFIVTSLTGFAIKASPNPVSNTVTVTAESSGSLQTDDLQTKSLQAKSGSSTRLTIDRINLYNLSGVRVRSIVNKSALTVSVDVKGLPAGIYILEVQSGKTTSKEKIIVQH